MIKFTFRGRPQFNFIILLLIFFINVKIQAEDFKEKFIIKGEFDLKTSEIITKKIEEIKSENDRLKSNIILLHDKLISKSKDKIDLNIYLSVSNQESNINYGIVQLTGMMNNIPLIRYNHPLIFSQNDKYPLFEGAIPLGQYEFKINAIVGQQIEKWPFILPEGKWSIEKIIKIDGHQASEKKEIEILLKSDKQTGLPQFEIQGEDIEK